MSAWRPPSRPWACPRARSSPPSSGSTSSRRTRWPRSSWSGVDPDRSLADHAFARRLHRRADTLVAIGPGPLVVAPDLASGQPADASRRAAVGPWPCSSSAWRWPGRTGIAADRIVVGAYPAWLADEPSATARILGEVAIRRHLFADHLLRFDEAAGDGIGPGRRRRLAVHRRGRAGPDRRRTPSSCAIPTRDTGGQPRRVGRPRGSRPSWRRITPPGSVGGLAASHAAAVVDAALATLDILADRGWQPLVGQPAAGDAQRSGARPRRRRGRRADRGVRPAGRRSSLSAVRLAAATGPGGIRPRSIRAPCQTALRGRWPTPTMLLVPVSASADRGAPP